MSIPSTLPPAFAAVQPAAPAPATAAAPAQPAAVAPEQYLATAAELELSKRRFSLLAHAAHGAVSPAAAIHFVDAYAPRFDPSKPAGEQLAAWRQEAGFYFRPDFLQPAQPAPPPAPAPAPAPQPGIPPAAVGAAIPPAAPAAAIPPPAELSKLSNAELDALIARKR